MCFTGWCLHEYNGDTCRKPLGATCPLEDIQPENHGTNPQPTEEVDE